MQWLFLGLVSLPLAAALYVLAQRLGPRLLEPVPEPPEAGAGPRGSGAAPSDSPPNTEPEAAPAVGRAARGGSAAFVLRAAAALVVLVLLAFGVSRLPGGAMPARPASVPPAAEVRMPAPLALKVQARFGAEGTGPAQMHDPRDVAVDPAGKVYVADTGNKRVLVFGPDGQPAGAWSAGFAEPSSLAVVKDGVIVLDSEAARVHKLGFDGRPVAGFERNLGLAHPRGVAVGANGVIYVADTANDRILKVGPDGAPLGAFDTKGAKLEQPTGVAIDPDGSVYSIEPAASRIQKFAPDGAIQAHLYLPNTITVYPPRAAWLPDRGLTVSLPDQNELLTYGPAGVPQATFAAEAPAPLRPLGLAAAPDGKSVWVVWNASAAATLLLWP